jgi:hypothetical protein
MSATLLYRIAAFVFVVIALGHTYAVLNLRAPSPEARAVYDSMNNAVFQAGGRSLSYGGLCRGLGLLDTVSLFFWAFLSWHLGELARSAPRTIGALGWAFFVARLASVMLSLVYFGLPAIVLSVIVAVIVGLAAWLVGR